MFFDVFKALCDEKGVSCKRATEEIGLSNSISTKWKKTGAVPNGETLNKIAGYFGVSPGYLLGIEKKEASTEAEAEDDPLKHALIALYGDHDEITEDILDDARAFIEFKMSQKKSKK